MSQGPLERVFAAALPGLEPVLLRETRQLDGRARAVPGGVELSGPKGIHRRANLWLRCANRVLLRLAEFDARDAVELKRALEGVSLADVVSSAGPVFVTTVGVPPSRGMDAAAVLSRALGRLTEKKSEDADGAGASLILRWEGIHFTLSADSSGELLHKRGYRQEGSRAPLRETLAAGILGLAGYTGTEPLLDPMCGSGTLLTEAALFARRMAPGASRRFAFEAWPSFPEKQWARELNEAASLTLRKAPGSIRGTDLNAGSLGTARRNAKRAQVVDDLILERFDALSVQPGPSSATGLVVSNLPYGNRVGELAELRSLYAGFARNLVQRFPGWRAALYVKDVALLEAAFGRPPASQVALMNGGIPCTLCLFPL